MRSILGSLVVLFVVGVTVVVSQGDPGSASDPPADEPLPEPVDEPYETIPGDEAPPRDPFTPYDTGPPEARWSYESLSAEEKAVVDRGRDVTGWDAIHSAYAAAAREAAEAAKATAAATQLGVEGLDELGVVP